MAAASESAMADFCLPACFDAQEAIRRALSLEVSHPRETLN